MPSSLIEEKDRVGTSVDLRTDLNQVRIHGLGIAARHDQTSTLAFGRADGPEDIGR